MRSLPSVNEVLTAPELQTWVEQTPHQVLVDTVREVIGERRAVLADGGADDRLSPVGRDQLATSVVERLRAASKPPLYPVINATGIILHTGLGRAPLAESAGDAIRLAAQNYVPLELDMASAERGGRGRRACELAARLTGAEQACVTNNNAAALVLVLACLAESHEVVVSRGELIEIGGGFRLPDIIQASGAQLVEVGTTNRTRQNDYEQAITPRTAALLKIHPSNYRMDGFVESVPTADLAELAQTHQIPLVYDIGSGALTDVATWGLADEPDATTAITDGADLVLFSADKLLGGPQAGIIVGRTAWVERCRRHPLMRAMRLDKLILAALAATLELHLDTNLASKQIPTLAMATTTIPELRRRAAAVAERLQPLDGTCQVDIVDSDAYLGGGSLPHAKLDSVAVRVVPQQMSEAELAARLRSGEPAVLPRVSHAAAWFDLRTVFPEQDEALAQAVLAATREDDHD